MVLKSIYQFDQQDQSTEGQAQGAIIFQRLQITTLNLIGYL